MSLASIPSATADPRERELRMLVQLVRLSRVTVAVAEAGCDKSEVVRSGVLPLLQNDPAGGRTEVAVLLDWWARLPLAVLNARIDEALARIFGSAAYAIGDAPAESLSKRLAARQQAFDCTFIIVFDRFEEYLAASPERRDLETFEAQFVEAVENRTLRANFLLALDEDAASLLAPLRERIPGLGDARVRLPKLESEPAVSEEARPLASNDQLVGSLPAVEQARAQDSQSAPPNAARGSSVERAAAGHAWIGQTLTERREPGLTSGEAPAEPIREAVVERQDGEAAFRPDATEDKGARRDTRSRPIWLRAALLLLAVLAVLGLVLVLPHPAGEPPADKAVVPPATLPAPSDATAAREEDARTLSSAPADEKALTSAPGPVDEHAGAPQLPAAADAPQPLEPPQAAEAPRAADPPPADEKPVVAVAPPPEEQPAAVAPPAAQPRAPEKSPAAAASGPPLLFIVARSDAQRAYAAALVEPLARHGIRVSGIRVTSAGPPVSDLRYYRRADRAEAARINRALDIVGRPAERLSYVAGFEEPQPRRHYELWLSP